MRPDLKPEIPDRTMPGTAGLVAESKPKPPNTGITSLVVMTERGARILGGFLLTSLVAGHLGADAFGQWSWAIALAAIVSPLGMLGLEGVLAREYLDAPEKAGEIASSALLARLLGGIASVVLGSGVWLLLDARVPGEVVILSLLANTFLFTEVMELRMLANRKLVTVSIVRFGVIFLFGLVRILGLWMEFGILFFVVTTLSEILLQSLIMAIAYKSLGFGWTRPSVLLSWRLLKESWPFFVASLAVLAYMRLSQVVLERFVELSEIGIYSMALRICEVGAIVPLILVQTSFPDVHNFIRNPASRAESEVLLARYFQKVFWSGVAVSVLIAGTARFWIPILLGKDYEGLMRILPIQCLAIVPMGIGAARTGLFSLERRTGAYLFSVFAGAAASLLLAIPLAPRFGIEGMAWVNVVSFWIAAHFASAALPGQRGLFLAISISPFHAFWRSKR